MKPSVCTTAAAKHAAAPSLLSLVALILAGVSPVAWPQALQPSINTDAVAAAADNGIATGTLPTGPSTAARPRNTYGEIVRPTVKRKAGKTELYQPIKKQDDDGQIPEIEMFVGESRVFPTPNVARIAVGNGQIMSAAALDDKETIIFANGVGTSSLFIWNEDGRYQRVKVNIVPGDTTRVAREVAAFLSTIPQAKASIVGDKVIVEGDTLSDEDREKVADLAKRYPQIVNFTSPIGWEKMVMMDVKVVEFPKTELRELGLKWTAAGGATLGAIWAPVNYGTNNTGVGYVTRIPSNGSELPITAVDQTGQPITGAIPLPTSLNALGALNLGLQARLNLLEQNGKASILAEPQLSARSGVKASFLAGGEIPYSVVTLQGVNVQFKQYGIKLDIEPRIGKNGVIRAVIDSEVSSIDQSVSTAAGPALLTRRTKTEFNARNGETIVLSGLLQRSISDDVDKVPFLGNIPVLGALFRSKRYQNKETELVVFVTPTIVDAQSPGLVDRVARTTERLSERLDKSPYLSDPLQPGVDADKPAQGVSPAAPSAPAGPAPAQGGTPLPSAAPVPLGQVAPAVPAGANPVQWQQKASRGGASLQVLREGLVLRAAPSDNAAALLELGYGSVVLLGEKKATEVKGRQWRNVVVGAVSGWVHADGVTVSRGQPLLRSSGASPVASKAVSGKQLALGDKPGVNGAGAAKPVTAAAHAQEAERYRVVLNGLALHVSPDVNSMVVTKLRGGDEVLAANQPPSGSWVAVQSGEARGWVAAQWLQRVGQQ